MKPATAPAPAVDQRILEAAAVQIRQDGAERVSVVRIAATLGMSHANVYRYFPSKAALVDAVIGHWLKPIEANLRIVADGPDPATDKLERMLFGLHRAYRAKLEADPSIFALFAASVDAERGLARKHRLKVQSEVQRVVDEGRLSGEFAQADQRRALTLVYDTMHRFIHPVSLRLDAETGRAALEARMERVARLMLRGLQGGR